MSDSLTAASILRDALNTWLTPEHWTKGSIATLVLNTETIQACALGAISLAAKPSQAQIRSDKYSEVRYVGVDYPRSLNLNGPVDEAIVALYHAIPERAKAHIRRTDGFKPNDAVTVGLATDFVVSFNDNGSTTLRQVRGMFIRALKAVEGS